MQRRWTNKELKPRAVRVVRGALLAVIASATVGGTARAEVLNDVVQLPARVAPQVMYAQLVPQVVQLPKLPVKLPDLDRTLSTATGALDPQKLVDLRRLRVRTLLREQRAVLEADPRGAPIVRAEVTAFSPSPDALDKAISAGFSLARERSLEGLDARIVVLRAPERMSTRQALEMLRALDPQGVYDFNHVYLDSGSIASQAPGSSVADPNITGSSSFDGEAHPRGAVFAARATNGARLSRLGASSSQSASQTSGGLAQRVGLIDGGVDGAHVAFANKVIHRHGCGDKQVASVHGTAVASLLVGQGDGFAGAAPQAELYTVDVYCGAPTGGAVDAIAEAFGWLAQERVGVINVSLVGPSNAMLEAVVRLMLGRGHIIVAAVGNDGPSSPPLYPAAYEGVVGVTGVDARHRVLLEALRGRQVDFAALGADLVAASGESRFVPVRGTSFAAPIVAGLLAAQMIEPDRDAAGKAVEQLAAGAEDLGARGRDPVYGQGLVAQASRIASK